MARLPVTLAVIAALSACTTLRSRGDEAFQKKDYLEAQRLYDAALKSDPDDEDLRRRRDSARTAVLYGLIVDAREARLRHDLPRAAAHLHALLTHRDAWKSPAVVPPTLAAELAAASQDIATTVETETRRVGPLAAEHLATKFATLLAHADFGTRRKDVHTHVRAAGLATCARLADEADTPYWKWIVAHYCAHWGNSTISVPALPNLVGGVDVAGSISGLTGPATHAALDAGLRASVWFARGAPRIPATAKGTLDATFSSTSGTRSRDYTVQVPYTDYETRQVSYQEPYDDTEYYTEQVPHTEYKTNSDGVVESQTVYRSESKSRSVTKYRTAYRSETVEVTKYRAEARTHVYAVIERSARYTSSLRAEAHGVVATIASDEHESGIDHDSTNSEAGVYPEQANLTTREAFAAREAKRLGDELRARLDTAYGARFCSAPAYDREAASACAYLDLKTAPAGVHAALRTVFGGDTPHLGPILWRRSS